MISSGSDGFRKPVSCCSRSRRVLPSPRDSHCRPLQEYRGVQSSDQIRFARVSSKASNYRKGLNYLRPDEGVPTDKEFLAAIDGVSDAQWKWKPAPERWSVGETAEHIVLAEALLFGFVRRAMAAPPNPAWEEQTKGKTELLVRMIPSRQGKAVAPEPIVPHEGLTRAQVKERFEKQRLDIVNFASETGLALKEHTVVHPFPTFGPLNAYQWLIYVPLHTIRHDQQIVSLRQACSELTNGRMAVRCSPRARGGRG